MELGEIDAVVEKDRTGGESCQVENGGGTRTKSCNEG